MAIAHPQLRVRAAEFFDKDSFAKIRARSDAIGAALIIHCWTIIFAAMALFYIFPNPLTFLLAIMLVGARQLGLAILMHDAAHFALFTTPKRNLILSDIFCAYPVWARTGSYRRYHLVHHAHTQQENDPDLILSKPFPITGKSMRRKIIRDLTGQTAFQQRKAQIVNAWGRDKGSDKMSFIAHIKHFWASLGGALVAQIVIFALCTLLFAWWYYPVFWLLPFFTYHMMITRLRNIAEHALVPDNDDPLRNARTTKAGALAKLLIAPYWVNYHVEHHLFFYVPCYRLPRLQKALFAQGLEPRMEIANNYWHVLKNACSRPDDEDQAGDLKHHGRRRLAGNFSEGFQEQ